MEEKPNYYAIIPADVRYDKDLKDKAKLLYGEITALSNKGGYCYATNKYFADLYGVSIRTITDLIKELVLKNYILNQIIYENGTKRVIQRRLYLLNKSSTPMEEFFYTPMEENFQDNNTSNNNINKKEIYKEKTFVEPTLEEIEEYCKSRNNNIDAKKFYDYYSVNNWKDIKGNKIKNWKQKVITWEGRNIKDKEDIDLPSWFDKDIQQDTSDSETLNELKDFFR